MDPALPQAGTQLGRYRLVKHLGSGAAGAVFQAEDTLLGATVCLKLLHPAVSDHPELLTRFKREVLLARRITHPNVCRLFDLHHENGLTFVTMEFVEGETLRDLIVSKGRLSIERTLRIIATLSRGLHAAHEAGVVHRDLKPRNIIVRPGDDACVLDFGVATAGDISNLTRPGVALGTLHYISPEVWQGQPASPRSDVYAVGIILFNCLTGRMPLSGDGGGASLLKKLLTEGLPNPSKYVPDVTPQVDALFQLSTTAEPDLRMQTAAEVADAADACLAGMGRRRTTQPLGSSNPGMAAAAASTRRGQDLGGETLPPSGVYVGRQSMAHADTVVAMRPPPSEQAEATLIMTHPGALHGGAQPGLPPTVKVRPLSSATDPDAGERTLVMAQPPSFSHSGEAPFATDEGPTDPEDQRGTPALADVHNDHSWVIGGEFDSLPTRMHQAPSMAVVSQEVVAQKTAGRRTSRHLVAWTLLGAVTTALALLLWLKVYRAPAVEDDMVIDDAEDEVEDPALDDEGLDDEAAADEAAADEPAEGTAAAADPAPGAPEVAATEEPTGEPSAEDPAGAVAAAPGEGAEEAAEEAAEEVAENVDPEPAAVVDPPKEAEPSAVASSRRAKRTARGARRSRREASPPPAPNPDKDAWAAASKALTKEQGARGIRADDLPALFVLKSEAQKAARAGRYGEARGHLEEARRMVQAARIDKAFVDLKLKRFNKRFDELKDPALKEKVVPVTIEVVQRLGRGEYEAANQALNRGFAMMGR